jgi:predicted DNA-binding transcriptional regulator YafY
MNVRHPTLSAAILSRLAAGTVKASDVAAAIGVSVRTVYRHVDRLRAAGHRIEWQAGVGFMLRPARAPSGHAPTSI